MFMFDQSTATSYVENSVRGITGQQVSLPWPPQCPLDQHNGEEELQLYNMTMLQIDDGHCHLDEGNLERPNSTDQYTITQGNEVFMNFLIKDCATILEMKEIRINSYPAADCCSHYLATCLVTGNPRPVLRKCFIERR